MLTRIKNKIRSILIGPPPSTPTVLPTLKQAAFSEVYPDFPRTTLRLQNVEGCWGGVSLLELAYLAYLAQLRPESRIFEIGTSLGRTTLNLAINLRQGGHVYTLDLPADFVPDASQYAPLQEIEVRQLDRGSLLRPHLGSLPITLLYGDSTRFDFAPWQAGIDLVFVDGGHVRSVLEKDTENAFAVVRPGGVIVWHDYANSTCPEVTEYLNEIGKARGLSYFKGTTMAFARC